MKRTKMRNDRKNLSGSSRPVDAVVIPADIWQEIEQTAKRCQRYWGMGFPVISITLLGKILKRDPIKDYTA